MLVKHPTSPGNSFILFTLLIFTYKVYSVIIFGNCLIINVYVLQFISNIVEHYFCTYLLERT